MSKLTDRIRAIRFDYATMKHMPRFRKEIREEKNRYITAQMKYYKTVGMLSDQLTNDHASNLLIIFKANYRRIIKSAVQAAPLTVDGLKSEYWMETKLLDYEGTLLAYVTQFAAKKIKNIANTTRDDIKGLIVSAFESGKPETEVIKAGLKARALSAYRADTIARTETHAAAAYASRQTVEKIASDAALTLEKKWMPTLDERTRPSHSAMASSEYIPMDEKFYVGGEYLEYPSDPSGSPENVINCRCTELRRVVL